MFVRLFVCMLVTAIAAFCKDEKTVPNNDVMQDLFLPLDNEEKTLIFSLSEIR